MTDLTALCITLDPVRDDLAAIREAAKFFDAIPASRFPWYFLTGRPDEIEQIRGALGYRDSDPLVDADRSQHAARFTFGNDRTDRWSSLPSGVEDDLLVRTIARICRDMPSHG